MALTINEFMARWFKSVGDFRGNEIAMAQMKADLEEMLKGPDSLWRREHDAHWASLKEERARLQRAKDYAKSYWDDNFMGSTREQCDKGFEESWHSEVVLIPSESIRAKEDGR